MRGNSGLLAETGTHKPLVVGSNPSAAIFYSTQPPHESHNTDTSDFKLKSLLKQIANLSTRKVSTLVNNIDSAYAEL